MTYEEYRPRLSVDIPKDLQDRLRKLVPWGITGKLITIILDDVLDLIEKDPNILGALLAKYVKYSDIMKMKERDKDED